ncbi:hypothetical protein [Kribbella sp. NPDC004875]
MSANGGWTTVEEAVDKVLPVQRHQFLFTVAVVVEPADGSDA